MERRALSRDPHKIRMRLRDGTDVRRDLAMLVEVGAMKPVSEWDMEELAHGRPRNSNGSFSGHRPPWLTSAVEEEIIKRRKEMTYAALMTHATKAMEVLGQLAADPGTPASVRADIGKFIFDHIHGKATAKVETTVTAGSPLVKTFLLPDGRPKHEVIDGAYRVDAREIDDEEITDARDLGIPADPGVEPDDWTPAYMQDEL